MDLELLNDIEELASLPGISESEIAISLGMNPDEFITLKSYNKNVIDALNKGRLTAKIEFIKKIKQLSNQGSGPAQTLLLRMKNDEKVQELRDFYA